MIVISIKEGESIDRALKRYKRKYDRIGIVRKLRSKQQFTKPSIIRREQVLKAAYIQRKNEAEQG
ncbi:MAG: 30S ribosomal protein S21 [Flavobacteriales bacterium]|nr:MAG: 30S ribosomal protein S21 [Flavobacteriales bacterium]